MGSESTYSECETFTDEDTGTLVPPECLDAAEEPGHGTLLLLPGRCVPTRLAGRGRRGPRGVPAEPEPAEAPGRGRGAACRVLMRRRGGDSTGAQGFVVTILALVTQRETRSSGRALTWPRGAGGLSLLSAAPWGCVRLLRSLSAGPGLRGSLQFRFPG